MLYLHKFEFWPHISRDTVYKQGNRGQQTLPL